MGSISEQPSGQVTPVMLLLYSGPDSESLRSRAFWRKFLLRIAIYFSLHLVSSILTSLPDRDIEKHPHSITLPPVWILFMRWCSSWFPPYVAWGIVSKWFNQTRGFGFSCADSSSRAVAMCLLLRNGFCTAEAELVECAVMVALL